MSYRDYLEDNLPDCEHCGGPVEYPDDTRVHAEYVLERDYCSRDCMGAARRGENHPRYKGGHINLGGYRVISVGGDPVYEHRHLMEQHLGRELATNEVVHHKNGDRADNRIENLEVMMLVDHTRHHLPEMIAGRGLKPKGSY